MKKIDVKIPLWIALGCCVISAIPRNQHTLFSGVLVGISFLIVCCVAIMRCAGIISTRTDNDDFIICAVLFRTMDFYSKTSFPYSDICAKIITVLSLVWAIILIVGMVKGILDD